MAALALACLIAASAEAGSGDGGSGTYTVTGTSFDFDLDNTGTTNWIDLALVGPPGTVFLGAATQGEITVPCSGNPPGGSPSELECGPISAAGLAPGAHILVAATMASAAACGQPFQLEVSSTGTAPFASVGTADLAGACTPAVPVTACTGANELVGAAGLTTSTLGTLVASLSGPWAKAQATLLTVHRQLRALLPSSSLSAGDANAGAVAAAETAASAAATVARAVEQASNGARSAETQARGLQTAGAALRSACEESGNTSAAPGSAPGAATVCSRAQSVLALATTAERVLASVSARLSPASLGSASRHLQAAARSLLSRGPGSHVSRKAQAAARSLDLAASLVGSGLGVFAKAEGSLAPGPVVRFAQAALARCATG